MMWKRYSNPHTGLDRPLWLQELEALRISVQSVHESGKDVSPTQRQPLPPTVIHVCNRLSCPLGYSAAERIWTTKIPVTPLGIEPTTFSIAAQCLNQLISHAPQLTLWPWSWTFTV